MKKSRTKRKTVSNRSWEELEAAVRRLMHDSQELMEKHEKLLEENEKLREENAILREAGSQHDSPQEGTREQLDQAVAKLQDILSSLQEPDH